MRPPASRPGEWLSAVVLEVQNHVGPSYVAECSGLEFLGFTPRQFSNVTVCDGDSRQGSFTVVAEFDESALNTVGGILLRALHGNL